MASPTGDFIYTYYERIRKVDPATGVAAVEIEVQGPTGTPPVAGTPTQHVVNACSITPDGAYLLCTVGRVFAADQVYNIMEIDAVPTYGVSGDTAIFMYRTADMVMVNEFANTYNDNLIPRSLQTDMIRFMSGNFLQTQPTSHEFVWVGTIERDVSLQNPAIFFMMSGAIHPTNETIQVKFKMEIKDPVDLSYRINPSVGATNQDQKKDGWRGLVEDPSNAANSIMALTWSLSSDAGVTKVPQTWIFSITRTFITLNWLTVINDNPPLPAAQNVLWDPAIATLSAPKTLFIVLTKENVVRIYKVNPVDGVTISTKNYDLTAGHSSVFHQLVVSEEFLKMYMAFTYDDSTNKKLTVANIDINKWSTTELEITSFNQCPQTVATAAANGNNFYSANLWKDAVTLNEWLVLSGTMADATVGEHFLFSLSTEYHTQSVEGGPAATGNGTDCYADVGDLGAVDNATALALTPAASQTASTYVTPLSYNGAIAN